MRPACAWALLATLLAFPWSPGLAGGPEPPPPAARVPVEELRERRDRLIRELREEAGPSGTGIFYIHGSSSDFLREFRQVTTFYYLTGLEAPGAALVLAFDGKGIRERLYLADRDPQMDQWTGTGLGPGPDPGETGDAGRAERVREITGIRDPDGEEGAGIRSLRLLKEDLLALAAEVSTLYLPPLEGAGTARESRTAEEIRAAHPGLTVSSAGEALRELRLRKSPYEVSMIREAARITCQAHLQVMRALRPGMKEYEIEALMEYVFTVSGARHQAFPTIVGSGPNATILHYSRNRRTVGDGELVLIDAGAEHARYAADITRTLPASGRFTREQRRLYRAVLEAQSEAAELVRPGARIREIRDRADEVLARHGLGSIPHAVSHFVGLDVHDVGDPGAILEPGMVLTVEPGAYLEEKGMGIRIEDLYLVTYRGGLRLSDCVPSGIEEIEAVMAREPEPRVSPGASGVRRW